MNVEPSRESAPLVAVVDDDLAVRRMMRHLLEREGFAVLEYDGGDALFDAGTSGVAVVCLDLSLEAMSGMEVLGHLRAQAPHLPVVVVTADRTVDVAVKAMRAGAYDYVVKPLDRERLTQAVRRAAERSQLALSVARLERELGTRDVLKTLVGESAPMSELAQQVRRVVDSDIAVCVSGESGTGKELVARSIHNGGRRKDKPFVAINCAAIPVSLQESELFGHERGAFTGAVGVHRGRFEQADGGTLFLDEVGEMSAATQAGLLRTLEERTIRRVGGEGEIKVDVRVVCATHRNLEADVRAGRFREDLFFRLVAYPISVPPLRERREDVPLLVAHFLDKLRGDVGRAVNRVTPDAMEALLAYPFPGNVRELQNVVHRAMLACEAGELGVEHLPNAVRANGLPTRRSNRARVLESADEVIPLRELERRAIAGALRASSGNVGKAAKLLGIARATLYRRLAEPDSDVRAGQEHDDAARVASAGASGHAGDVINGVA
jgi:DNA-binding NtrC family response regulator